jgi:hypothetical protein
MICHASSSSIIRQVKISVSISTCTGFCLNTWRFIVTKSERKAYDARRYLEKVVRKIERGRVAISSYTLLQVGFWTCLLGVLSFFVIKESAGWHLQRGAKSLEAYGIAAALEFCVLGLVIMSSAKGLKKLISLFFVGILSSVNIFFASAPHFDAYKSRSVDRVQLEKAFLASQKELEIANDMITNYISKGWLSAAHRIQRQKSVLIRNFKEANDALRMTKPAITDNIDAVAQIVFRIILIFAAILVVHETRDALSSAAQQLAKAPIGEEDEDEQENPPVEPEPPRGRKRRGRQGKIISFSKARSKIQREDTLKHPSSLRKRPLQVTNKIRERLHKEKGIRLKS